MNIFFLDRDPAVAARMHTDKHVVKMVLETAQILSTAHAAHGSTLPGLYKPTHAAHPCVRWVGASRAHYAWAARLGLALTAEYTYRYEKRHACTDLLERLAVNFPSNMPRAPWVDPPQCMPEEYQDSDAVSGYRRYYAGAKMASATWKKRSIPSLGEVQMAKSKSAPTPQAEPAPVTAPAPAPVPQAEPAAEKVGRSRTSPNFPPTAEIEWLVEGNPKREGSKSHERFGEYYGAGTVGEYIEKGGTYGDLKYDAEHGYLTVEGFAAKLVERKVRAPKAEKPAAAPKAEKPAPIKRKAKAAPEPVEAEEESDE